MILSVLIPSLKERAQSFNYIFSKLRKQAEGKSVEILPLIDNREKSIGTKRNELMQLAKGEYLCFVDDDDDVSDTYIDDILSALLSKPDCVSLIGIITFSGQHPRRFIHSIKYKTYYDSNGIYFRPPNHLNPIKSSIAKQFLFPEKNFGEDTDWAMRVCNAGVLKIEAEMFEPYYYYKFEPNK